MRSATEVEGSKLLKALGIDPGTHRLGYAVVTRENGAVHVSEMDVIALNGRWSLTRRFQTIYEGLRDVFDRHAPDLMMIETPFYHHNVQTSLKLGRVIGIAMALAFERGVSVEEISPAEAKKRITGNGRASKVLMERFLSRAFGQDTAYNPHLPDAVDALGIAYAHFVMPSVFASDKKASWKAFLRDNPHRIRKP